MVNHDDDISMYIGHQKHSPIIYQKKSDREKVEHEHYIFDRNSFILHEHSKSLIWSASMLSLDNGSVFVWYFCFFFLLFSFIFGCTTSSQSILVGWKSLLVAFFLFSNADNYRNRWERILLAPTTHFSLTLWVPPPSPLSVSFSLFILRKHNQFFSLLFVC